MEDLDGRVAIVTGAARGTGAAIAKRLIERGSIVFLGDIRDEDGVKTAEALGERATFVLHDVTSEDQWRGIVDRALGATGRIDILVNNAAVLHLGKIENTPADVMRRLLEVNTVGPYLGMRAVLPAMKEQAKGSIVNVGSIDGLIGMNGITSYCASKFGLRGLAKSAALELGRHGIRVNSVCPSGGNPAMYGPWMAELVKILDQTQAYTANRAIPGEVPVEVIADAVCFFASDASLHCTGVDLPVDGGAVAGRFIPGFSDL